MKLLVLFRSLSAATTFSAFFVDIFVYFHSEKILKNVDVPPRRVPNYPNAKGDLYHYKHRVDDDDDLYKGSDFMDMDEKLVPLKTDRSDGH